MTAGKITNLHDRAVLQVSGPEACSFLHNLVTADIAGLDDGCAVYSALLTPQGKVLFDFFVLRQGDVFLIDCAREQSNALMQRLGMYKLRADVETSVRDDLNVFAIWKGEPVDQDLAFPDPRDRQMGWRLMDETQACNADEEDYHAHRIARGIADTIADIGSGDLFPHEANMDQLSAISFTKGCYIGQEVVSRMQHRGTARTRFLIAEAETGLVPDCEISAGDRRIGTMKSVAGHTGLCLVRTDRAANALANGVDILCGPAKLSLRVPDWATFTLEIAKDPAD